MKLRSTMEDVRKVFEDQSKYFSTDEVAKYHKMSIKVLKLMKELEKTQPELIKEHNQVLEVLLNNYDQQIENIKSQINIIGKFFEKYFSDDTAHCLMKNLLELLVFL